MRYTHVTLTAYGFWLPNDPRGSGSRRVRAQHLYEAGGGATRVTTRRSVAHRPHDRPARLAAKRKLKFPAVQFTGQQARAIARGIAEQLPKVRLDLLALAVLPDHLHAVTRSIGLSDKQLRSFLKTSATRGLNAEGLHPLADYPRSNGKLPSPWSGGGWSVWLETEQDVRRTIQYVEQNPIRAGLRRQVWSCVTEFHGFGDDLRADRQVE